MLFETFLEFVEWFRRIFCLFIFWRIRCSRFLRCLFFVMRGLLRRSYWGLKYLLLESCHVIRCVFDDWIRWIRSEVLFWDYSEALKNYEDLPGLLGWTEFLFWKNSFSEKFNSFSGWSSPLSFESFIPPLRRVQEACTVKQSWTPIVASVICFSQSFRPWKINPR